MPIASWDGLNKILTDALHSYNELNAAMDLVRFILNYEKGSYCFINFVYLGVV